MRVLAFRHVPFEGAGWIERVLEQRGIALEYVDLYRPGATLPDTASAAGLLFLGGPMSVNDDLPYLRIENGIIKEAIGRGQPVLGICLGSQLIAQSLGARVSRNPQKEIGWFPIRFTDEGMADALFEGLNRSETVFHWHGETFDLPEGAALLAMSERCRHQAFRLGDSVYGLQFHVEVTPEMIADWCLQDENCGDLKEIVEPFDPEAHAATQSALALRVFGRWAEMLDNLQSERSTG